MKKKILVLCTGNSCRSQMAEGYLNHFAVEKAEVVSAGVEAIGLNPLAVAVMKEDGIDISHYRSKLVDDYLQIDFDYIITVCDNARERCPYIPSNARRFHTNFPDPAHFEGTDEQVMHEFRHVRDMIKDYCLKFTKDYIE
jgi:arsenate reductase